jgi:hypothetical protein
VAGLNEGATVRHMSDIPYLDLLSLRETIGRLTLRINDRFPRSGLSQVCANVHKATHAMEASLSAIHRPNWALRGLLVVVITCFLGLLIYAVTRFELAPGFGLAEFIQTTEAAVNDLIFLGVAMYTLWSIDIRIRRARVLARLGELRELAHIVDMHQLTKDPGGIAEVSQPTPNSPKRDLTAYELGRYLDYCSELLALISKLGAVYTSRFSDRDALENASDLEALCTGLSQKVWQKLIILRGGMMSSVNGADAGPSVSPSSPPPSPV